MIKKYKLKDTIELMISPQTKKGGGGGDDKDYNVLLTLYIIMVRND